jgi:acyl carrier protein
MNRGQITAVVRTNVEQMLGGATDIGELDQLTHHGLDSLLSVELMLSLEGAFAIVFEDEDLSFENFQSVHRIVDLVAAKVGA